MFNQSIQPETENPDHPTATENGANLLQQRICMIQSEFHVPDKVVITGTATLLHYECGNLHEAGWGDYMSSSLAAVTYS